MALAYCRQCDRHTFHAYDNGKIDHPKWIAWIIVTLPFGVGFGHAVLVHGHSHVSDA